MTTPTIMPNEKVWRWRDCQCIKRGGSAPYPEQWFWQDPVFGERGPFSTFEAADKDFAALNAERARLERFARIVDARVWERFAQDPSNRDDFLFDNIYASLRNARSILGAWENDQSREEQNHNGKESAFPATPVQAAAKIDASQGDQ